MLDKVGVQKGSSLVDIISQKTKFDKFQYDIYLFGRDIMTIPCFRISGIIGCSSLIGTTLLTFLCTSNSAKAMRFGFGAFLITTFPYWCYCRQTVYSQIQSLLDIERAIKERNQEEYVITDSLINESVSDMLEHGPDGYAMQTN